MWSQTLKTKRSSQNCTHETVQISATAGLQRSVCLDCGHVSISYISEALDLDWLEGQSTNT